MSINRRDLLAGLALTPLVSPLTSAFGASTCSATGSGLLNVFFQGLFFWELKQDASSSWLEITAPKMEANHDLLGGVLGNLQDLNNQTVDWRAVPGLPHCTPQPSGTSIPGDVPKTMYQFTRKQTGVGGITGPNQGKILLPWPSSFFTIRNASRPALTTRIPTKPPGSQVHMDVENLSSTTIGVVTLLQYTFPLNLPPIPGLRSPTVNLHFYFQPKNVQTVPEVNDDLRDASPLFQNDNFDLKIDENASAASTPIGASPYPTIGVTPQDELALNERVLVIPGGRCGTKVQDCLGQIQVCLEAVEADLSLREHTAALQGDKKPSSQERKRVSKNESESRRALSFMMANPANCPMFFVG
jgi:hypothetical protein